MTNKELRYGKQVLIYVNESDKEPRLAFGKIKGLYEDTPMSFEYIVEVTGAGVFYRKADEMYNSVEEAQADLINHVVEQ